MQNQSDRLPVRQHFTLAYLLSLLAALLMIAVSLVTLLSTGQIYPAEALRLALLPNDMISLAIGLPLLLLSMWLARRGRLIGLLLWPGVLLMVVYMYTVNIVSLAVNVLFLPYILLVTLGAYTIVVIVANTDGEAVKQRLEGAVPARISGGILAALAVLLVARQAALVVTAIGSQEPVDSLTRGLWIADMVVGSPVLLIGGVLLWRRQALGYVAGAGVFLQYGVLAVGLVPVMWSQARATGTPVDVAGIVIVLIMAAICFVPLAFFVRGAAPGKQQAAAK